MVRAVLCKFVQSRRPCPYKGHIALKDIDKLRKLVQAGLAQEPSDSGNPGIVLHLEHQAVHFILLHQLLFALLRIRIHGAELVHLKNTPVTPHPFLGEKDRPRGLQLNKRPHNYSEQKQNHAPYKSAAHIQHSLQQKLSHRGHPVCIGHRIKTPELGKRLLPGSVKLRHRNLVVDGDPHLRQDFHVGQNLLFPLMSHRNDHLVQGSSLTVVDQALPARNYGNSLEGLIFCACAFALSLFFPFLHKGQPGELIAEILHILQILHQRSGKFIIRHQQQVSHLPKLPVKKGQHLFPELMNHKHQYKVQQKKIKESQTGIGVQHIQKVQDYRRPREHEKVALNHMHHLMQRPPQKHVPVGAAQQIHTQKDGKTEVHPVIVAAEKPAASYIIGKHQADRDADTVQH